MLGRFAAAENRNAGISISPKIRSHVPTQHIIPSPFVRIKLWCICKHTQNIPLTIMHIYASLTITYIYMRITHNTKYNTNTQTEKKKPSNSTHPKKKFDPPNCNSFNMNPIFIYIYIYIFKDQTYNVMVVWFYGMGCDAWMLDASPCFTALLVFGMGYCFVKITLACHLPVFRPMDPR